MFWLWLSLSILMILFILILFTKVTILVNYYHHNDNDDLKVEFRIWFGLIRYKKHIPLIKIDDDSPSIVVKDDKNTGESGANANQITPNKALNQLSNTQELLHHVIGLHVIIRKFLKKVTIKKWEWQTMIGVGDAAYTGMATGAVWAIKSGIIGILSNYLRFKTMPQLSVIPHFQAAVIQTQFSCIFQFRIGHAMLAGLKLIKFWRGGKPHFKKSSILSNEKTKSV